MPFVAAKFARFSLAAVIAAASVGLGIRAGLPDRQEPQVPVAIGQSSPPPASPQQPAAPTAPASPATPPSVTLPVQAPPLTLPVTTAPPQTAPVTSAPPQTMGPPGIAEIDLGVPIGMPYFQIGPLPGVYEGPGAPTTGPGVASYLYTNLPGGGPSPHAPRAGLPGAAVVIYSGKCAGTAPNASYTCVGGVWATMWPGGSSNLSAEPANSIEPYWVTPGTCASPSPGPTYKCVNGGWVVR